MEGVDLNPTRPEGNAFSGKKSLYVVDQGDVVAEEKNVFDFRSIVPQEGRLVNQDQGFSTARRSLDDMVPRTTVPGYRLLVVVEDFDPLRRVDVGARVSFSLVDANHGKQELFEMGIFSPS